MEADLSVVIPMHNGAETVGDALRSLAAQVDAPRFEVIVADNGSTDGSVEVVHELAIDLPIEVRVVDARARRGAAHARNVGAAHAASDRLVFCDCDDTYDPHFLRAMHEALDQADIVAATHERPEEYAAGLVTSPVEERPDAHAPGFAILGYLRRVEAAAWGSTAADGRPPLASTAATAVERKTTTFTGASRNRGA